MQMIADGAGLPKANIHYYFESKERLYRRVVECIFEIWSGAAASFEQSEDAAEALQFYIKQKMQISRLHGNGSKVWANEVMQGAPIINDFLQTVLQDWTDGRIKTIQSWVDQGRIKPINPRWLLYMIWATTQHYADFAHQIKTLNQEEVLSLNQWHEGTETVFKIIRGKIVPDSV